MKKHTCRSAFGKELHDGVDIYDPVQYRAHRTILETEQQDSNSSLNQYILNYRVSDKLVCGLFFVDTGAVHCDAETLTCPFAEQSDGHFAPLFDENMGISICSSTYAYNSGSIAILSV